MPEFTHRIGYGAQADVYLENGYAYKVFHTPDCKSEAFYEAAVTAQIETTGLPIARVYEVVESHGCPAIRMDYCAGENGINLMTRAPHLAREYMNTLIDVQTRIHNSHLYLPLTFKAELFRYISAASMLSDRQRTALLADLSALPDGDDLCHGDFHAGNLLFENDRYTIIDWINAKLGHRFADICRTYMLYYLHDPAPAHLYLQLYCDRFQCRPDDILQWLPVLTAARLMEGSPAQIPFIMEWMHFERA